MAVRQEEVQMKGNSGGRRSAAMKNLRQGRVQKEVMMSVTVL